MSVKGVSIVGRWGLKADPTGADVTFTKDGVTRIARVDSFYHRDVPSAWMLRIRHFDGSPAGYNGEIALSAVKILEREYETL